MSDKAPSCPGDDAGSYASAAQETGLAPRASSPQGKTDRGLTAQPALYRCIGCDILYPLEETGATWDNPRKGPTCWCEGCKPCPYDVVRRSEPDSTGSERRFG